VTPLDPVLGTVAGTDPIEVSGEVSRVRGLEVDVTDLPLPVGSLVGVETTGGARVLGEIVGTSREHAVVMLLGQTAGISAGDRVLGIDSGGVAPVGERLLGRVVDGLVRPIDGRGGVRGLAPRPLRPQPVNAMARHTISEHLATGVRAIDLFCAIGRGQRLGIFAGPGVGKSTLLGSIARHAESDVNVVALIGERGREVREFVEKTLGPEALKRTVVVVATGDESPVLRVRAALAACSIAEYFRDDGADVLLVMDSVTRFAHAQRQIGLASGEPPTTRGYTPSVYAQLSLLLERAGTVEPSPERAGGSITGMYTVLVEGDDLTDPIADATRGILDGHVVLARKLAQRGHFPAIDVLDSISRVADAVSPAEHARARRTVLRLLAEYDKVEDLVQIGAYARGSSPVTDVALDLHDRIDALLRQQTDAHERYEQAAGRLVELAAEADARLAQAQQAGAKG